MISQTAPPPEPLMRYPRVDAAERNALHQWLHSLSSRDLVTLLADRRVKRKLTALKHDELVERGAHSSPYAWLVTVAILIGATVLGVAAVTLLP